MPTWTVIVALVGALGGGGTLVTIFGTRLTNRTTRESGFMDQQQETITALEQKVARIEAREMVRDDYIQILRQHIADGKPPPPPPFPSQLTGAHT